MNSASRLHDIFSAACNKADQGLPASATWLRVFDLEGAPHHHHEDLATQCVVATREEIEALRVQLKDRGCPEDLYGNPLDRLKNIASVSTLQQDWKHLRASLTPDLLVTLAWSRWILDDVEEQLAEDERNALLVEVEALIQQIESSSLPAFTRGLVLRHCEAIRRALQSYKVRGVTPLQTALNEAVGSFSVQKDRIVSEGAKVDEKGKGFVASAMGFITKTAELADKLDKTHKGIAAAQAIGHTFTALYHQLGSTTS